MSIPSITVSVTWKLPDAVWLLGEVNETHGGFVHEVDLGMILFARHVGLKYGALCNYVKVPGFGELRAISLTPIEAVAYFQDPERYANQFADITWSEDIQLWQQSAIFMDSHLRCGRFVPDFLAWQQGIERWKPNDDIPNAHGTDTSLPLNVALPIFDDWFDAATKSLLKTNPEIATAWEATTVANPWYTRARRDDPWFDEEDFLIALGLRESRVPFQVSLRLDEPTEENGPWSLIVFLHQKDDESIHELWPLPLDHPWQAYAHHVNKHLARVVTLFPWLEANNGFNGPILLEDLPSARQPFKIRQELDVTTAWRFLTEASVRLPQTGISVFVPAWWTPMRKTNPRLTAQVKSPVKGNGQTWLGMNDTLRFDWRIAIGDVDMSESEFRALVERKQELVHFRGQWIAMDDKLARELERALESYQPNEGMPFHQVLEHHLLGEHKVTSAHSEFEAAFNLTVEPDPQLLHMIQNLEHVTDIPHLDAPTGFQGTLRPYQQRGYSWLCFLQQYGLGACLADDMGLGKTVQYIAYVLRLKELQLASAQDAAKSQESPGADVTGLTAPFLLVCPTSVLGNWQRELAKFAPSLRVHIHYGSNRPLSEAFVSQIEACDVVLTSYNLCHLDLDTLSQVHFASICLDEAQNIKNPYTKQALAIRKLKGWHRIALTGTPIENRLTELWSIFQFLNPGYLGSLQTFNRRFASPIERNRDTERIQQLQSLIQPFMLRRTKHDESIALDLPAKSETKEYVPLTSEQASLYTSVVEDMLRQIDTLPAMARRGLILASLTRLKQLCDHPALFLKTNSQRWRNRSAKLDRLVELVSLAISQGDKCLIFTQFVEAGELLTRVLQHELGQEVLFLHGGLPKATRDNLILRFQSEDGPSIFTLSLKAGGVGLNLTAANHVFHFDRWWNPAVEDQATDRAYRIGQTRHVQVHKFLAIGTLEERIDQMIDSKQTLRHQVVGSSDQWITELSTDQLRDLFLLKEQWEK